MTATRDFTTNTITITNDGNNYEREGALINALYALENIDTYVIGESFCINNFCEGCTLWSCYADMCYLLNLSELETLPVGRTITLYPRTPDEYDRELIAAEYGEEVTA